MRITRKEEGTLTETWTRVPQDPVPATAISLCSCHCVMKRIEHLVCSSLVFYRSLTTIEVKATPTSSATSSSSPAHPMVVWFLPPGALLKDTKNLLS